MYFQGELLDIECYSKLYKTLIKKAWLTFAELWSNGELQQ